jgi:porin
MFRFFGSWELIDRSGDHPGALVWKFEHRHGYSDVPPSGFGFEAGYVGLVGPPFSDQGWRTTNLYWRQRFAAGRLGGHPKPAIDGRLKTGHRGHRSGR